MWYTSLPVALSLLKNHRLTMVGTLRNKREIPPTFIQTKQKQLSSSVFGFGQESVLVSYVLKKNKVLLSTKHDDDNINKDSGPASKPEVITFYDFTKAGVDVVDELKATYSVSGISNRWSLTIFYSLLNISAINAYVILRSLINIENRRTFLKTLSLDLTKEYLAHRLTLNTISQGIRRTRL